jgi:hypothetical protein
MRRNGYPLGISTAETELTLVFAAANCLVNDAE